MLGEGCYDGRVTSTEPSPRGGGLQAYLLVAGLIALCLVAPPFTYLLAPRAMFGPRREWTTRVEYDHEYFGAI